MTTSSSHDATGPAGRSAEVDAGSWDRFTPSLGRLLDGRSSRGAAAGAEVTVRLSTPAPILAPGDEPPPSGLRRLLGRGPRRAVSPEAPTVVLIMGGNGVEVTVPVLDGSGRLLLGRAAVAACTALGWSRHGNALSRLLPDGARAAEATSRLLIEVLRVPHPADIDCLVLTEG